MVNESTAQDITASDELKEFCQVIAEDIAMLAVLHETEPTPELLEALGETAFPAGLGLKLLEDDGIKAIDLMKRAMHLIPEKMEDAFIDDLAADYANIYLNYGISASPEESVWLDEENLACQDSMFQVRNWYEQYGLMAKNWRVIPDDHLVLQLQFLVHLFKTQASMEGLKSITRFMDEHLLRWLLSFAERVAARCDTAYFAGVAMLTASYCEELRDLLAKFLDIPRPSSEEIEQRLYPVTEPEPVPVKFMPGIGPAV